MRAFSVTGRIRRRTYLLHTMLSGLLLFAVVVVGALLTDYAGTVGGIIGLVLMLGGLVAFMYSEVCVTIQRLHDLDRSGWHYLLLFIPIYNIYLGLMLMFKRGTNGPNAYGPDPTSDPFHARLHAA